MVSRRHGQSKDKEKPEYGSATCVKGEATSSDTIDPPLKGQPSKKPRLQQPLKEITNNVYSLHEHGSGAYYRHVLINVVTSVLYRINATDFLY